jgi:hypothetical protein
MRWLDDVLHGQFDQTERWQRSLAWLLSFVLGVGLMWPWWGPAWQHWQVTQEAQALAEAQRQEAQDLQRQTEQIWAAHKPTHLVPDVQRLSASLSAQGLVVADVGMERVASDHRVPGLQVAQVPVRVGFEGAWSNWQDWLQQLPAQLPGATVAAFDLKPTQAGRFTAQATLSLPRVGDDEGAWELASAQGVSNADTNWLDAQSWLSQQQTHAQSAATLPAFVSGSHRVKDPLEFFSRSQLQYVGVIGWGDHLQALVRVNDPHTLTSIYRVPLGGRLGKDAGRVRVIDSDHLLIDEWVQDAAGQWRSQEVRMPLWAGGGR